MEAENENTPLAGGFWVVNLHVPGVAVKAIVGNRPRPADANEPINPWQDNGGCCQVKRKSANTARDQARGPELKFQGGGHRHCSSDGYEWREVS